MKKQAFLILFSAFIWSGWAQIKTGNQPVFTIVKENPITSIKNQNRSGTCWSYASLAFFESEILRESGKTYDLSEMFVANKDYMDCAENYVRLHSYSRFSQGGSTFDALEVIQRHGICPESVMPASASGALVGDSLANFNEFFSILEPFMEAVAKNKAKGKSTQWRQAFQSTVDAYLGKCPKTFTYEGVSYTPQSFARSLGLDWNEYTSITSYTHHPFYTWFNIEAPYKWRYALSYNVPMNEMMEIIDHAVMSGYTVAWGGDVSEDGFTRTGLALSIDDGKMQDLEGSDAARWLKLSKAEKTSVLKLLGVNAPEVKATQERRQERFDNWGQTYDHVMLIFGIAKDQTGREYYVVKNSWGRTGDYDGIWYMSKDYIADNTTYIFLNKKALK